MMIRFLHTVCHIAPFIFFPSSASLYGQEQATKFSLESVSFATLIDKVSYSEELRAPSHIQFRIVQDETLHAAQALFLLTTIYRMNEQDKLIHEKTIEYMHGLKVVRYQ